MSDLSEQMHIMRGLREMPMGFPGGAQLRVLPGARPDIVPDELHLRGLRTPLEIAEIQHLRQQIRLPAAVLADPGFATLEKKETTRASSPLCSGAT